MTTDGVATQSFLQKSTGQDIRARNEGAELNHDKRATEHATVNSSPPHNVRPSDSLRSPRVLLALVTTAIVFFLLGSLIRSLLSDNQDYFAFVPRGSANVDPDWQEITRIVELRIHSWHVVLAIFRGRPD